MNNKQSWNMITMFCLLIFGFTVATFLHPDNDYSVTENRSLAQMPAVSPEAILDGSFEEDYEKYLTDQFVLRDMWIGLKTVVERAMLKSESKDIYFAADEYLIEKHSGVFETTNAANNIQTLQKFVSMYGDWFDEEHMSVMLIPNSVDILRDKLPAFASPFDEESYLKQLRETLPAGVWTDASEVLMEHADEEIYYRTDHHWETLGAFYVYQRWCEDKGFKPLDKTDFQIESVTDSFLGTVQSKLGISNKEDTIEIYQNKETPFYTVFKNESTEPEYSIYYRPALETKSKYDIFFGGNHAIVRISTKAGTGRRAVVLKDSYAHCFVPFLLTYFDEIDMVDLRYYNQKLSELITEGNYTDLICLYNAAGFAEETSISRLLF